MLEAYNTLPKQVLDEIIENTLYKKNPKLQSTRQKQKQEVLSIRATLVDEDTRVRILPIDKYKQNENSFYVKNARRVTHQPTILDLTCAVDSWSFDTGRIGSIVF